MMSDNSKYDHRVIEARWQKIWEDTKLNQVTSSHPKPKTYVLDMFPYPSAAGLHVGHPEGYTATDIYCRFLRMTGHNVLHPIGWDAFGLPAENYAIKTGRHPRQVTMENIDNFKRQIQSLGFSYDWSREVNTADPAYYKWTQWLFLKLYEKGLAYRTEAPVNWCPSCQTVLANEQVINGQCERCGTRVEQRQMKQWFFKITAYAERLLAELQGLDWPAPIVDMQRNWIGKSEGVLVKFEIRNSKLEIDVFTTRLDTIFGATFVVLSPELAKKWMEVGWQVTAEIKKYVEESLQGRELERVERAAKEKTGVDTGMKAINPATNEEIPVWIADYVIGSYGTGAIMAVPAHDQRDFEFADKFDLPIKQVVVADKESEMPNVYTGEGVLINSANFTHLSSDQARKLIAYWLKGGGLVKEETKYKIRDWLISRQRYWGAPIPIIYCDGCGEVPVVEKDLPVELPDDVDFRPTGESPLARSKSFHNVKCSKCGKPARRESDTMDTFVDSSWYFLRYCDPHNQSAAFDPKPVAQWCPVDLYVGGAEHAVLHLLYARFVTKVLYDWGYLKFTEPFLKLINQGLILGEDGQKMSKSRGNVINPDEIVVRYGADTLRLYEMFMGPLSDVKPWHTSSIIGIRRFLEKVWSLVITNPPLAQINQQSSKLLFQSQARIIQRVTNNILAFKFNTAISGLMEFTNLLGRLVVVTKEERSEAIKTLLMLLYPFAPHITSELWQNLQFIGKVWEQSWPDYNQSALLAETITIAVQVNGRLRATIEVASKVDQATVAAAARARPTVAKYLIGKLVKTVYVPGRLINFVVK